MSTLLMLLNRWTSVIHAHAHARARTCTLTHTLSYSHSHMETCSHRHMVHHWTCCKARQTTCYDKSHNYIGTSDCSPRISALYCSFDDAHTPWWHTMDGHVVHNMMDRHIVPTGICLPHSLRVQTWCWESTLSGCWNKTYLVECHLIVTTTLLIRLHSHTNEHSHLVMNTCTTRQDVHTQYSNHDQTMLGKHNVHKRHDSRLMENLSRVQCWMKHYCLDCDKSFQLWLQSDRMDVLVDSVSKWYLN